MTVRRTTARLLAAPAALGIALLGVAGPASAHVTVSASETAAGSYTVLTVSVPHGCDGSATKRVAIRMPEEILAVTPTRNPFWTVTEKQQELAEPLTDAHGNTVIQRDAVVVYTAKTPLPDGQRDVFELSVKLPEEEGTLVLPTIQTCVKGTTAWVEVAADGQGEEELEHPAPTVIVTPAVADGSADTAADEGEQPGDDTGDKAEAEESSALAATGLGAGVLGLLAGGAALVQVRRKQ